MVGLGEGRIVLPLPLRVDSGRTPSLWGEALGRFDCLWEIPPILTQFRIAPAFVFE